MVNERPQNKIVKLMNLNWVLVAIGGGTFNVSTLLSYSVKDLPSDHHYKVCTADMKNNLQGTKLHWSD